MEAGARSTTPTHRRGSAVRERWLDLERRDPALAEALRERVRQADSARDHAVDQLRLVRIRYLDHVSDRLEEIRTLLCLAPSEAEQIEAAEALVALGRQYWDRWRT